MCGLEWKCAGLSGSVGLEWKCVGLRGSVWA